jgi:hypothetical protein
LSRINNIFCVKIQYTFNNLTFNVNDIIYLFIKLNFNEFNKMYKPAMTDADIRKTQPLEEIMFDQASMIDWDVRGLYPRQTADVYVPRTPLPCSACFQCEHDDSLGYWDIECKEPCLDDSRYCAKHHEQHQHEKIVVDVEKDFAQDHDDGKCHGDLGEWGYCTEQRVQDLYCSSCWKYYQDEKIMISRKEEKGESSRI